MRIMALINRILKQFVHDKRTIGLMIFAPILVLSLLYLVFAGDDYTPKVTVYNAPVAVESAIEENANVMDYSKEKAMEEIKERELDAVIDFENGKMEILLEGSNTTANQSVILAVQQAAQQLAGANPSIEPEIFYFHGDEDMEMFDHFGPVLIGFFAFFFVFLIAGVSFLRERTGGTLERLLASPLKRWEIVMGYVFGFGIFTTIQSFVIVLYAIYVLDMYMVGEIINVLIVTLLLSLTALTLGILLSAFANNELQMMQFIPIVVVPQVFFSGLFNLETISDWVSWIGPLTPLYYGADALKSIMIRGASFTEILTDIYVLLGFSFAFIVINIFALRKYRRI